MRKTLVIRIDALQYPIRGALRKLPCKHPSLSIGPPRYHRAMATFRIEEKDTVNHFAAILAHIRRGDEILIAENGSLVTVMNSRAASTSPAAAPILGTAPVRASEPGPKSEIAAYPDRLPAPEWDGEPSKRPWLRRKNP